MLEEATAQESIAWALETFHPNLKFACSFQKTSSVTLDIATRIDPAARFFYLDTDVLFEETYTTRDALAARYGIEFERYSGISLEEQAALYGDKLWTRQPDACCGIRKVEPMREALSGIDCWVSGIRRVDSADPGRSRQVRLGPPLRALEAQPARGLVGEDVWNYINEHDVPYNPLHDAGYPSIGCTHCTRAPARARGPGRPLGRRRQDRVRTELTS